MFYDLPPQAPEAVSFSRDVAPIFAFHCGGCHGAAAGLSLRSYAEAMAGGNKGQAVIAGDPDGSLLLHFVEGKRGEKHRMPLGGAPLTAGQIETLRRWVREGARADAGAEPLRYVLRDVRMTVGRTLRVVCVPPVKAFLTVTVKDPANGKVLWQEAASVKDPKEANDAGRVGERLQWDLRAAPGWPAAVEIEATLAYAERAPEKFEFSAGTISDR